MSWHVEPAVLHRYQTGMVDRLTAASVEMHLTDCARCRGLLEVDGGWLDRSWTLVAERVEPGAPNLIERVLSGIGFPQHLARVVAVSPAMRLPFLLALVLVLGFAVVASNTNPEGEAFRIFLLVAPLIPVAGIAFAFGRLVDPAHELSLTMPIDTFRLLLLRAISVLVVAIGSSLAAWPLVPAPASMSPATWLLPALALASVTLALGSRVEMWLAGSIVAGAWAMTMTLTLTQQMDPFGNNAQLGYLALALVASMVVMARRHDYDREGGRR